MIHNLRCLLAELLLNWALSAYPDGCHEQAELALILTPFFKRRVQEQERAR